MMIKLFENKEAVKPSKSIDIYNTDKKFRVIYSDPAWEYPNKQDTKKLGGASKHYNTMPLKAICDLPVKSIVEKDAVLFLWITSPLLPCFMRVMEAWGFQYKSSFIWYKGHNMSHYNSLRHEFLLVGGRGSSVPDRELDTGKKRLFPSVYKEKQTVHSRKPSYYKAMIDSLYIKGNKLEMFARRVDRAGWDYWGNEV